jgi:4-amino-4-deoxy-L-arabinose transferase-like glycosyltransferase
MKLRFTLQVCVGNRPDGMDANASVRRWLSRILCVALGLRVVVALGLQWHLSRQDPPPVCLIPGDAEGYWDLAGDLAEGHDYSVYTPPRRVLRMPGFPALLALPRAIFGDELLPVRLLLAGVGAAACWGVFALGRELFDPITGLIAAALAAVSPMFIGFSPLLLSETTFTLALLLSLIAGARLVRTNISSGKGSWRWGLSTGLASALACYVRPSWLLAVPAFGVLLIATSPRRSRAVADVAVLHAALFLALLPWGLRNRQVTGHFVLTTLWMGPSLYDGLRPDAQGDSDMSFYDRDNLLARGLSEYEVDRHYRTLAWQLARDNPGRVLELAVVKLWRYGKPWPNADQFGGLLPAIVLAAFTIPMLALALVGMRVGWAVPTSLLPSPSHGSTAGIDWWAQPALRLWRLAFTAGPILYFAAVHAVFVSSLRYRLPAEYPLLILSAVGLQALLATRRAGDVSPRIPPGEEA